MPEPLSYKELEQLVKDLRQEKNLLQASVAQKENQLVSVETLYKQIIDNVDEGVFLIHGEKFKFINREALSLLDTTRKEIETTKFSEIIHPEYRGEIIQLISEIVESKTNKFTIDSKIISQAGKTIFVKLSAEKLPLINNKISILVKVANKAELVQKQEEVSSLKKSYDFLNSITDDLMFVLEFDSSNKSFFNWRIKDANEAAVKAIKNSKEEIIGKLLIDFLSSDVKCEISGQIEKKYTQEFEVHIYELQRYFNLKLIGVSKDEAICKFTDINDLYHTKNQLSKNLQRNELLTEILRVFNYKSDYIEKYKKIVERIVYHFKPRRLYIFDHIKDGKKAKLLVQYSTKEVNSLPENFEIPLSRIPSWVETLNKRKMMLGFSLSYLPSDVRDYLEGLKFENAYIFPLIVDEEVAGSVVFENNPNSEWDNTEIEYLKMVTILVSSIASRKSYEEKLVSSKEKAEQADRLKSSFLASMSHDIRIPMTAIIGFSDLLADPDLTFGEREEFIELITKSGHDLLTLVDNIVDVAKIETGQLKIQKDTYVLSYIFDELYFDHSKDTDLMQYDDLELIMDLPDKYKSLGIDTDVFRFKQIFSNLIENAIKFTDKGVIHFGVSNVWQDTIEFYVQDTGIGIAEETQQLIFERFGKIDRSYTKEYSGTGLGLSICQSLVALLDGEIRVVSYPGKGSAFYFTHPLAKTEYQKISQSEVSNKKISNKWSDKKIMIAEDVEQNYKVLEYILQSTGVEIFWAKDGKIALDFIKAGNRPDLILMDIRMPVLNGIDATKEILKIAKIPIVVQTAYTLGEEKQNALDAGCIGYLSKPINSEQLFNLMGDIFADSSLIE
ncbi:MAG: response regulator [Salinivirgaceae bacterium]|nr:response regulator [Salinivirgaceae bacterium]